MTLTVTAIRDWVMRKLGHPIVCVELDASQLDEIIKDAYFWWTSMRGWYRQGTFNAVSAQVEYDLSAVDPAVIDVTKVWFTASLQIDLSNTWNGFLDISGYPYDHDVNQQVSVGFYSGLVQWLQMRDTAAKVLSVDDDWFFNTNTKVLSLTPAPQEGGKVIYLYQTPFKSEYLSLVPPEEQWLIREYALAEAMWTLGRIRGKYRSGLPAAQGSVSLDGDDLIREAEEKKEKLEEKLLALIPPPRMMVG